MRKAIDALAADNLVVRRQGKGTFVATHTEERSSLFRFLRIRRNDGGDESAREPPPRRHAARKAGAEVARLLALKPGDPVLVLRRVLDYAGEPVVLDEITLPAALFRGLTKARYDAYPGSMYSFFETQFGVRMLKAQERIRAVAADAATAASSASRPARRCSRSIGLPSPTATARSSSAGGSVRPPRTTTSTSWGDVPGGARITARASADAPAARSGASPAAGRRRVGRPCPGCAGVRADARL